MSTENKVVRGIRGATTVKNNDREEILTETEKLLQAIVDANEVQTADIAAVFFTVTADLNAAFPAAAARRLGWTAVPLLDAMEIPVPGSLSRCIRIMLLVNTTKSQDEINHVYLNEAVSLRPDLVK